VSDLPETLIADLGSYPSRQLVIVGIDGQGGAGKTVLAQCLAEGLRSPSRACTMVHFDDFFLPSGQRPAGGADEKPVGGDFDWRRLRDEVLLPLREERRASYARYDWTLDALAETHVLEPQGVVIVEGIYCTRRELADLYDLRIWVECPRDVRLARGLERDGESARQQWERDWMPAEDRYVSEHQPQQAAHRRVSGIAAQQGV
jgi:uridine kinase